jgi:ABC-type transporter Mla maintaining outer membrane lipid asymmetry ATPase subunit MlaF
MLCSLVDRYQRFGVTGFLNLRGRCRQEIPSKRWELFSKLHGVIFQKTALFIVTDVRTSNVI